MGMLYQRGNVWWVKYYRHGKCFRESSKSTKKMVAQKLLIRREGEILQGNIPGILFDKIKFDELAEDLLRDYRINEKKSLDRASASFNRLKSYFEGMPVSMITTHNINLYIEQRLNQGVMNATINRELSALKRMLNLGARQTPPKVNRVPYIPMLKENNTRKGFFEHHEFLMLRKALPAHVKGFVTFGYKSGWRISEISGLNWRQVDLIQGIVRLDPGETKNSEARTIYLDDELKSIFQKHWDARKTGKTLLPYVFLNKYRTDRVKRFDKAWKKACKEAKIGIRLFHDFRRTAVRNMVRAGIPERVAMVISGHKTRSVFDRYNIVNDQDLIMAAKQQQAYLEGLHGHNMGTICNFAGKNDAVIGP
jgi:integrase